jgi:hypothetical protein
MLYSCRSQDKPAREVGSRSPSAHVAGGLYLWTVNRFSRARCPGSYRSSSRDTANCSGLRSHGSPRAAPGKAGTAKKLPDPELQAVISAWATPPGAVQAGIKAAMAAAARELEWRRLARHYLDNSGQRPTGTRANGAGGYDPRAHGRQWGLLTGHWDGGCKPPAHE